MSIRLIEEHNQTGEDWAIYEVTVPYSGDWVNYVSIECMMKDNRIDFDFPIKIEVY